MCPSQTDIVMYCECFLFKLKLFDFNGKTSNADTGVFPLLLPLLSDEAVTM